MSDEAKEQRKGDWSVVVLYEDGSARELGVQFCDALVERFWNRYNFDVSWWPFDLLGEAPASAQAAQKAQSADYIIFSSATGNEPPLPVRHWVRSWLPARSEREGAIVRLVATGSALDKALDVYLRRLAHEAGLDFLTDLPQHLRRPMPESLDSYSERAGCVTSVLDEIMVRRPRPPGL